MARTKAPKGPAAGSPVFAGYPDGPTTNDIADPSSPWFVSEVVRENFLALAADPGEMRKMDRVRDSFDVNQEIAVRNFAIRWQQSIGAEPQQSVGGLVTMNSASRTGSRLDVDEMVSEVKRASGATSPTIHRFEWTLSEAAYRHRQAVDRKRNAAADRWRNTCAHCGDVVPGCERECHVCLDAMEFYNLQQAAESERGKRAIEKLRATRG